MAAGIREKNTTRVAPSDPQHTLPADAGGTARQGPLASTHTWEKGTHTHKPVSVGQRTQRQDGTRRQRMRLLAAPPSVAPLHVSRGTDVPLRPRRVTQRRAAAAAPPPAFLAGAAKEAAG